MPADLRDKKMNKPQPLSSETHDAVRRTKRTTLTEAEDATKAGRQGRRGGAGSSDLHLHLHGWRAWGRRPAESGNLTRAWKVSRFLQAPPRHAAGEDRYWLESTPFTGEHVSRRSGSTDWDGGGHRSSHRPREPGSGPRGPLKAPK